MRLIFLFCLFILISACSTKTPYKSTYDYWNQTAFSFNEVKSRVNDDNCSRSEKYFLACVDTLNYLSVNFALEPFFMFVSEGKVASWMISQPGFLTEELSPVVKWTKANASNKAMVIKLLKTQGASANQGHKNSWDQFYKSGKRLPFGELLDGLLSKLRSEASLTAENEKYIAASAHDLYMSAIVGPYTYFYVREELSDNTKRPDVELQGIGVELMDDPAGMLINRIIKGGPAANAGLLAGDIIVAAKEMKDSDFFSFQGKKFDECKNKVRGTAGSKAVFKIKRLGGLSEVTIARASVIAPPMEYKIINEAGKSYLYLAILTFYRDGFCPRVKNILKEHRHIDGIILDLRNNGGGSTHAAECLTGFFLPEGKLIHKNVILKSDLRAPNDILKIVEDQSSGVIDDKTPMIVLVNRYTASASEYVTAALQDHDRAIVAGERTVGKGTTLQAHKRHEEIPYMDHHEDLFLYYAAEFGERPRGTRIEADGITPDVYMGTLPTDQNMTTKSKSERLLEDFPWVYVWEFNQFEKWQATPAEKVHNEKLKNCLAKNKTKLANEYAEQLRKVRLENPDFGVMQAISLFQCGS